MKQSDLAHTSHGDEPTSPSGNGSSREALSDSHQREMKRLRLENQSLLEQKKYLEDQLRAIALSNSWRMTAPLRAFARWGKIVFPLLRNKKMRMRVVPERKIAETGSALTITGQGAMIDLLPEGGRYPSSWIQLKTSLRAAKDHTYLYLYLNKGSGFSEQERALLVLKSDGSENVNLLHLPAQVFGIRLSPFDSEGTLSEFRAEAREIGTIQVLLTLAGKHLAPLFSSPSSFFLKLKKAFYVWKVGGMGAIWTKLFQDGYTSNYAEWVKRYGTLSENEREKIRQDIGAFSRHPLISLVMPVYNPAEQWLRKAIESVAAQLYPHWELCIADDCSPSPHVRKVLEEWSAKEPRIKVSYREKNGHISEASNTALTLATGEFVAFLDHDDELSEHALYLIAKEIVRAPEKKLIYTDEDKITEYGLRFNPYFKSDWNPDLLLSQNYICHLLAAKRSLVEEVGGFRKGVEGAQDWDLILRMSAKLQEHEISHLPFIAYHWRSIESSTANSTASKPYVLEAQRKAVNDYLESTGIRGAETEILYAISQLRVHWPLPHPRPLVSLIIPTKDKADLLRVCVESIFAKTEYPHFEVIVIDNNSEEKETFELFEELSRRGNFRVVKDTRPFNFSALNNNAAREAKGEILGFLNNDLEVITHDWLSEMVSLACRNTTGAVGARLLFPNGLVQHGGIVLGIGGIAGHNHKGAPRSDTGYFNRSILMQNFSAVTAACLVMRRSVFEQIRGFDEDLSVAFNDVDLCLRIRAAGYRIVFTPYAELYHYESASRGYENTPEKFARFESEISKMLSRWKEQLGSDPYYNPNLTLSTEDFAFSFPPRVKKPWDN